MVGIIYFYPNSCNLLSMENMKIAVKFNPQYPKAEKSNILVSVTWEGNRIQKSIGISVKNKNWDKTRGKVKSGDNNALEYNMFLEGLSREISNYYYRLKNDNMIVSREIIRNKIKSLLSPEITVDTEFSLSLVETFNSFKLEREKSGKYSQKTIEHYSNCQNYLRKFSAYLGHTLYFSMIDKKFTDKFMEFLLKKPMMSSSAIKILVVLKVFLNDCYSKKIVKNIDFRDYINQTIKENGGIKEAQTIVIDEEELQKLEYFKSEDKILMEVKHLFLLQIYTGLRVSDLMRLKPENFNLKEKLISIMTKKTADFVTIPLHRKTESILSNYPNLQLPKVKLKWYNEKIREVCKIAKIDKPIIITKFYGKRRKEETHPKYELISSHTARRTFITLSLKKGLLPEYIMKITGHRSRASFQKYVRIVQEEAINEVRRAWDD